MPFRQKHPAQEHEPLFIKTGKKHQNVCSAAKDMCRSPQNILPPESELVFLPLIILYFYPVTWLIQPKIRRPHHRKR